MTSSSENRVLLASGYDRSAKALLIGVGVLGPLLFLFAFATDPQKLTTKEWFLLLGLLALWGAGISEAIGLRVWIMPDRICYRDRFFQKRSMTFSDIREVRRQADRVLIVGTSGQQMILYGRMEHFESIIGILAAKSGREVT